MPTRRQLIQLCLPALAAAGRWVRPAAEPEPRVWLPIASASMPLDAPIVGPAGGSAAQAQAWFAARNTGEYTRYDIGVIVGRYQQLGAWAGVDWFLALAQLVLETDSLRSWWAARPRRNPAGIGVTGRTQPGAPNASPGANWAWDMQSQLWREGVSFATWVDHAIPAHLGRLLAYARTDAEASAEQRVLIDIALGFRPLPASYRGIASTIVGLNGRWAVPGTEYGQSIVRLMLRMRGDK